MITPEQVQTAIAVLNASVAEQLGHIDAALLDQLTDAIDLAAYGPILDDDEADERTNFVGLCEFEALLG